MASSGIKRGLASTAVAALAVTGAPMLSGTAFAVHESGIVSQINNTASVKADGQNTTIRLEAESAGDADSTVRFEYRIGSGDWQPIATVPRNDDGYFSYEWAATAVAGNTVDLRAVGISPAGAEDPAPVVKSGVEIFRATDPNESVNLNDGSALGYFDRGNTTNGAGFAVALSGTSSSDGGDTITVESGDAILTGNTTTAADGTWSGVFVVDGFDRSATPDQIALNAIINGDTDDTEAYTLYRQTVGSVDAVATDPTVQSGDSSTVVVTVLDQAGAPIAGIIVDDTTTGAGDSAPQTTDAQGRAIFDNADAQLGGTTETYYADFNDNGVRDNGEQADTVTVAVSDSAPATLTGESDNGAAFDTNDEYDADDITITVRDASGRATDDATAQQQVRYYYVYTPFGSSTSTRIPLATATPNDTLAAPNGTDRGEYLAPLPGGTAAAPGTYELFATLTDDTVTNNGGVDYSKVLTVKAGDATLTLDGGDANTAQAGGNATVSGTLTLQDGTGLPNRNVALTYGGTNAEFVDSDTAPAPDQATTVVTGANGGFSATLRDPSATPQTTESGTVTATSAPTTEKQIQPSGDGDDTDTIAASDTQTVEFIASNNVGTVAISPEEGVTIAPGDAPVSYTVTVLSTDQDSTVPEAQRVPLANREVTLTTTAGYFTDGNESATQAGVYDNDGQTITVRTDEDGQATFQLAAGRVAGLDDDGVATATITATAGGQSDTATQEFSSDYDEYDEFYVGALDVLFSDDSVQDSGVLPKAQSGSDRVLLDVVATDQFGNVSGGVPVDYSDNTGRAFVEPTNDNDAFFGGLITDYDSTGDLQAFADGSDVDQIVTATITTANSNTSTGAPASKTASDSETINWYAIDFANSTFTLTNNTGDNNVQPGTPVTETFTAVDQNGEAIRDIQVDFFRTGPDTQQNGEAKTSFTNAAGKATYTFIGTTPGTATVSTTAYDQDNNMVDGATKTDTVTFSNGGTTPPPPTGVEDPTVALKGRNNGARPDRLRVVAEEFTAGATVRLFQTGLQDRPRRLVAVKTMNDNGSVVFKVRDRNRKKFTQYRAFVRPQEGVHTAGVSNRRRVR